MKRENHNEIESNLKEIIQRIERSVSGSDYLRLK
jgi:hypothetical protein